MGDYEAVYNVKLTKEQLVALKGHPRFEHCVEVEDSFGSGEYNLGLLSSDREDEFVAWCEENGIKARLL